MPEQPRDSRPGDPRVNAALADYLQRIDRGEQVAVEQFLAGHADIAGELRSLLITSDELAQLRPADSPAPPPVPEASTRSVAEQNVETIAPKRVQDAAAKETFLQRLPDKFGRYRIIRPLGSGAMGDVYLAEDSQLHRQVALKTPSFDEDETGELLERFYREARSAAGLRHSHICPVFDVGEINGRHYISMAYIEGQPLSAYIRPDKPQPERQALAVIRKLALAIQEAHDHGIIHRDLKPGNVMIDRKTEPIVMDFGLARPVQSEQGARLTQSGMLVGSPAYMSPEQVEGETEKLSPATDQYSLGVILYELLTGSLPFRGGVTALIAAILTKEPKPPSQLRSDLDPRIEALCLKMMAKSPRDRYPSMRAVAEAIAGILKSEPVPAEPDKTAAAETPDSKPRAKRSSSRIQPVPAAAVPAAAVSITASNVESLFDAATKCMRKHDYEQVVQLLDAIPDSKRNDQVRALLMKARELADEVAFLIAEIDEALRLNDNDALAKKADALLKLKPKHHKALQIKEELGRYGSGRLRRSRGWTPDGSRIGEGSWIPWLPLSLFAGVFGLTLLMVTLYLRVGDAVVRVQITDPNVEVGIQNRTLNVKSANQNIKVDPGEDTLKIAYNGAEFETDKFTLKQGENPALVIELLDKTLSAKFGDLSIGQWPVEMSPPQNPAAGIAPRNGDVRQSNNDEKQRRDAASFAAGTVWKGKRAYRKGAYAPSNVTYELHVQERNGNQFQGHVFDNGPGRNRAEVEGTIEGTTINWRERSIFNRDNEMTMQGTLDGNVIHVKFTGYYGANRPTNEGDGELTLDAAVQPSAKPTPVPPDAVNFGDHSYKFFPEKLSWKAARAKCTALHGQLVVIDSAAENAFVARLVEQEGKVDCWIDATDEVTEGTWLTEDGRPLPFSNWCSSQKQPNNKPPGEHFALMSNKALPNGTRLNWEWSDQPNDTIQHDPGFVCEWDESWTVAASGDWIELFNGKDLTGWKSSDAAWQVRNGVIDVQPDRIDNWADLVTDSQFSDFELRLQYRILNQGYLAVVPRFVHGASDRKGARLQLGYYTPQNETKRNVTGDLFAVLDGKPAHLMDAAESQRNVFEPAVRRGDWIDVYVRCEGPRMIAEINGQRTIDYVDAENRLLRTGQIAIGAPSYDKVAAEVRNIRVRPIPSAQPAENDSGGTDLFNGRDLTGWDVIRGLAPPQSPLAGMQGWEIQDGVLKCMTSEFLWLRTNREYQDFALSLEFQLPPQGAQTGVYFRNPGNRTGWDGMMAQIVSDNSKFPANMHSGGITKFVAPAVDAMRPAGQWNSMEIECRGRNVRIVVNGQVTVDVDTTKTTSLSDRPQSGYIGLANYQGEANGAAFRNIRIRELPPESPSPTDAGDGWTDLVNGSDLTGWTVKPEAARNLWRIENGILSIDAQAGNSYLWTNDTHSDFALSLEYRLGPDADAGVIFRSPEQYGKEQTLLEVMMGDGKEALTSKGAPANGGLFVLHAGPPIMAETVPPSRNAFRKGEWNSLEIVLQNRSLDIKLNAQPVLSTNLDQVARSKPVLAALLARRGGYLGLQGWKGRAEYRNIRFRDLSMSTAHSAENSAANATPADPIDALQGKWQTVAEDTDGTTLSPDEVRRRNRLIVVNGASFTMTRVINGMLETYPGTFAINAGRGHFDWLGTDPSGAKMGLTGIYSVEGDTLKLCYRRSENSQDRPTEFKRGQKRVVILTLKRKT